MDNTIGLVTIRVADLEKLSAFYQQVIGLKVWEQSSTFVLLGSSIRPLLQLKALANGRFLPHTTGLFHNAFLVPTRADLANWLKQYAEQQAPYWQGASDHGASNALYLSDPEGNGIEVYYDLPRTHWPRTATGSIDLYTHTLDLQTLLKEATNQPWQGIADNTTMGHIHLQVSDITQAKDFYVNKLGFDIQTNYGESALFIAYDGYHHHIGLNTWQTLNAPHAPEDAYGLAEFGLTVSSERYTQITTNLPSAIIQQDNVALLHDPFGNTIRLMQEKP